jgi:arabinofuranosyltransferase
MHLPRRVAARLQSVWASPRAPVFFALAVQIVFAGYLKDDAFIEYRYAQNFAHGHGLVFNVGDPPVEGFTSFLWTIFLALPAKLGLDLVLVSKFCGALALLSTVKLAAGFVARRGGDARAVQLARWLAATNASLLVWATSGMEPVICAFVVLAAANALDERRELPAMLLLSLACLLRPECHLLFAFAAIVVARRKKILALAIALVPLAVVHYARWRYFHSLVPNTALVKAATFDWYSGTLAVGELFVTSAAIVPIAIACVVAWRRRDDVSLFIAASLVAFVAYLFRIGHDEMFLARLYLPVWPLALVLAAAPLSRMKPIVPALVLLTGIGFTCTRLHTIRYLALGMRSHVKLADIMKAHAQPGDLVVFQDLGQTPYAAMDLRFIDPIGLVDPVIARIRHDDHASPFHHQPKPPGRAMIRDHIFSLAPKLVAFVAYIPKQYVPDVTARLARTMTAPGTMTEREQLFAPFVDMNAYYVGLHADERFRAYRFVDVVERKDDYWFVLYER